MRGRKGRDEEWLGHRSHFARGRGAEIVVGLRGHSVSWWLFEVGLMILGDRRLALCILL